MRLVACLAKPLTTGCWSVGMVERNGQWNGSREWFTGLVSHCPVCGLEAIRCVYKKRRYEKIGWIRITPRYDLSGSNGAIFSQGAVVRGNYILTPGTEARTRVQSFPSSREEKGGKIDAADAAHSDADRDTDADAGIVRQMQTALGKRLDRFSYMWRTIMFSLCFILIANVMIELIPLLRQYEIKT